MTGGPHPSAAGNGRAREAGRLGRWRCWAGLQAVTRGRGKKTGGRGRTSQERAATQTAGKEAWQLASLFFYFYFLLKQANTFGFKPGFESKHPKTMHRHECNTHNYLFDLEKKKSNQGFFSYTIFPVKKNKIWAKF
jgi:hypothetical protein